ncbi:MAG TPA: [protein-PII] uridylyltransferase [Polyangiaceae bacterium]|nr:[protein-PII] uridylyltransferase [Polyangiaceae bacterium]
MPAALEKTAPRDGIPDVLAYLKSHLGSLVSTLEDGSAPGDAFARRHAKVMDGLLTTLFPAAIASLPARERKRPVLLAAVGGYGRGLLGWKSDLDVRLVTTGSPESIRPLAEAMLYPLWDAGVSIGHQVTTIDALVAGARTDLPTATSLLDLRPLAGDPAVAKKLEERAFAGVFSEGELGGFLARLETEATRRHHRFGDSVYLLEPDVKSGAGGLRDLDIGLWAARARYRVESISDLLRQGVLVAREADELARASSFLWTLRNFLHFHANRRSDRLTFEEQETIANLLGYRASVGTASSVSAEELDGAAVEAFMSDYYRHARVIMRAREQLLERAKPPPARRRPVVEELGQGLRLWNGMLTFVDSSDLNDDPALALRIYAVAVARGVAVLPFARDVLRRKTTEPDFCERLRASEEAARCFVTLASTVRSSAFRGGSILGELHDVGLLVAMIPEFAPVVGRVHHDVYHVYTVDVHSIAAVDHLRALARGELVSERPLASRVALEVERPEILHLATLLHDVGKAIGGKDHSRRGAEMSRVILRRLGLPEQDVDAACRLVWSHLTMYTVAMRRNLEDPTTIEEFSREVTGQESLRELFLLTVADLSTTSPTSMTKWKSRMLDELYVATDAHLSGTTDADAARLLLVKARVKEAWPDEASTAFLDDYLATMPDRYLLSNAPLEIVAHARVVEQSRGLAVTAAFVPSRHPDVAELCVVTGDRPNGPELCVVTGDRPGLLAAITAAITGNGLEVHAAQIHTRKLADGGTQAVDLFWITDRSEHVQTELVLPKLAKDLERVVAGAVEPKDLLRKRSTSRWSERPVPAVPTEVVVDNRASSRHTVVEVVARDRPGLLFTLSQALHDLGLTIVVAKINTEGTRVVDVFYVTELDGRKLEGPLRIQEVRQRLFAAAGTRAAA